MEEKENNKIYSLSTKKDSVKTEKPEQVKSITEKAKAEEPAEKSTKVQMNKGSAEEILPNTSSMEMNTTKEGLPMPLLRNMQRIKGPLLKLRSQNFQRTSKVFYHQDELFITEQKTKKSRKITINPKVIEAINFCSNELKSKEGFTENGYVFANRWGGAVTISYVNKRLKVIFKKYHVNVKNASSYTFCLGKMIVLFHFLN